jgi:hypothetical protein
MSSVITDDPKVIYTAATARQADSVPVKCNGKIYNGSISGKLNDFARISILVGDTCVSFEFAWSTIAHALNTDKPLRVA